MTSVDTIIIGASAAGLASAACLQKEGLPFIVLEKSAQVATAWRNHYDRLHLHTSKKWSALPFREFDASLPTYPSRQDVVDYLDRYATALNIHPAFNTEVLSITRDGNGWITRTAQGNYQSRFVIVATGQNHTPLFPEIEGLNSFKGITLHSAAYKNGKAFAGKNVLVVGFGNSACEQAICLFEQGAHPFLSVRSPVNVIPRDIFGFPVLDIGKLTSRLPPRIADRINAPLLKLLIGDITKLGLRKSMYGPLEQIEKQHKIPVLDIGVLALIRQGQVHVHGGIERIDGNTVYFENNQQQIDAIIFATGYHHSLETFMDLDEERMRDLSKAVNKQIYFGKDGLYFCGFFVSPTGVLREIGIEARKISRDIALKSKTV